MNVQVVRIADRGVPNNERIHLSVVAEMDLCYLVVLKTLYAPSGAGVFNGTAAAYWFPQTPVRPGDQVILYSGKGTNTSRKEPSGTTTYFFYWGFGNTLFNNPVDCVVLMQGSEWNTSPRGG